MRSLDVIVVYHFSMVNYQQENVYFALNKGKMRRDGDALNFLKLLGIPECDYQINECVL